ncbi:hypothetical protein [Bacteroides sp. 224]|uniref:hypothetical protein n=1 Tax=Bacteroides sp. 224 TaxID=2302936 RepID=UPI0013D175F3|nr:hypothetical protein [Bacteroides sp. 224]NDV65052.1 hypothetical protein [Bacteroides sp. 224]
MSTVFFPIDKKAVSDKKRFGLCDNPPPPHNPAYLDEKNGELWIAVVENDSLESITFYPLDNCIVLKRADEKKAKCCDAVLVHDSTVIFVELKQRTERGKTWIVEGEEQLRSTITHFNESSEAENYEIRKAYIANSERPVSKKSWLLRMERFFDETGYILRIGNRIKINEAAL